MVVPPAAIAHIIESDWGWTEGSTDTGREADTLTAEAQTNDKLGTGRYWSGAGADNLGFWGCASTLWTWKCIKCTLSLSKASLQNERKTLWNTVWKRYPTKYLILVLMFIWLLGLYLCKPVVIYHSALKWTATSGKAPPRVSTILHPWSGGKLCQKKKRIDGNTWPSVNSAA